MWVTRDPRVADRWHPHRFHDAYNFDFDKNVTLAREVREWRNDPKSEKK